MSTQPNPIGPDFIPNSISCLILDLRSRNLNSISNNSRKINLSQRMFSASKELWMLLHQSVRHIRRRSHWSHLGWSFIWLWSFCCLCFVTKGSLYCCWDRSSSSYSRRAAWATQSSRSVNASCHCCIHILASCKSISRKIQEQFFQFP